MNFDPDLDELIWNISLMVGEYLVFDTEQPIGTTVPLLAGSPLLNEWPLTCEVSL